MVLALPELLLVVLLPLLELVEPASFDDDGVELGEVELEPKELVDGLEPKVLVLVDGLLKPPYVVSPWSPMPNKSRPNDSQAQ